VLTAKEEMVGHFVKMLAQARKERGQMLIMLVLLFTVIVAAGAVSIDVGLWLSERRGAQSDADLLALAGAWELLDESSSQQDARDAVDEWLVDNEESGNTSLAQEPTIDNSCFGVWDLDAVAVDVDHESRSLFSGIFGVVAPEIGAHAKACAGAAEGPGSNPVLPFETDPFSLCFTNGQPNVGGDCVIEFGSQGPGSQRGFVDVRAGEYCSNGGGGGGSAARIESIALGAQGTCLINQGSPPSCDPDRPSGEWFDCVASQGGNAADIVRGVRCRLTGSTGSGQNCPQTNPEPLCDNLAGGNNNGIDDFEETVIDTGLDANGHPIYEVRDCDPGEAGLQASPRIGSIFVLPENPNNNGNSPDPIIAFAGFYLKGCHAARGNQALPNVPPQTTDQKKCIFQGQTGHVAIWGTFVNLLTSGGGVGQPNPGSTIFGIALVE
jgi:Putative Flp pilus-assembly TadE/G-like